MSEDEVRRMLEEIHRASTEPGYNLVAKVSELRTAAGHTWIRERVALKVRWVPEYWEAKLGPYQQVAPHPPYRPENVTAYYFESLETTIFVDTVKGIIIQHYSRRIAKR